MKLKSIVFIPVLAGIILLLGGCAKSENFFAYGSDKVNKKIIPGEWEIQKLEIWIIDDMQSNSALDYLTFNNVGNIEFMEDGDCHINFNGGELDATYLTLTSTDTWEWNYLSGSFHFNEYFSGNVTYLDKENMIVLMPWSLNLYLTDRVLINCSVEFRFTLKKN